ncbi:hypothetical protein TNCT_127641 [Trichonephila clavata]|uniref:Uncharacterized protein n=1 Tax=Trichonephila clavata TaxID=2740835 RepID=A0A8X6H8K0_TRICU|nr:hypothetical protein TNCT_127641 [Trichonephila clavata]
MLSGVLSTTMEIYEFVVPDIVGDVEVATRVEPGFLQGSHIRVEVLDVGDQCFIFIASITSIPADDLEVISSTLCPIQSTVLSSWAIEKVFLG